MDSQNYRIDTHLYSTSVATVYRAHRLNDQQRVLIKLLNDTTPTAQRPEQLQHEYAILQNLTLGNLTVDGVVCPLALEKDRLGWLLVLEDFGGELLTKQQLATGLALELFLKLAMQAAQIVAQVHQQRIIHKNITTANLLFNPTTQQVKLTGFEFATPFDQAAHTSELAEIAQSTLAYCSPEQSGRMNRVVDYRTDLYALGIVFYEWLTGVLPFVEESALSLIHAHIAKQPQPPHLLRATIPPALSAIILRLLAKNAEDRYPAAESLLADLQECWRQWQQSGTIHSFALGQYDRYYQLQLPPHLYDRTSAKAQLLDSFTALQQGGSHLLLVTGEAGVGKSALVYELAHTVRQQRGFYLAGKFDQLERNLPYAAFIQIFRFLIKEILGATPSTIAEWRTRLLAALGANIQVIVQVVPELQQLVGPQPPLADLDGQEAQNRFNFSFVNFIRTFAAPATPLVLFLDDLQWADRASLLLLDVLLNSGIEGLLVVCAYRSIDINVAHPVHAWLAGVKRHGLTPRQIVVEPLKLAALTQFVADTFAASTAHCQPLAQLILQKTGGIPFFINEFLKFLWQQRLVYFQAPLDGVASKPTDGQGWHWNLERIQQQKLAHDVVQLLSARVLQLPAATQQVLKIASCIGARFTVAQLALVDGQSSAAIIDVLSSARQVGLILPSDQQQLPASQAQSVDQATPDDSGGDQEYQFAHDRIQDAVYALLDPTAQTTLHYRIGRLLLQNTRPEELDRNLFDIVDHLNKGLSLFNRHEERQMLLDLNLRAGQRAKVSTAFASAAHYLQVGLRLLPPAAWQTHYELALAYHNEAMEAAFLTSDFAQMQTLADVLLTQAHNTLQKTKAYEVLVQAATAQNRPRDAIELARTALEALGFTLPERSDRLSAAVHLLQLHWMLRGKSTEQLLAMPALADPHLMAAMRIFVRVSTAIYIAHPHLLLPFAAMRIKLSLQHGMSPGTAMAFAIYASICCQILGDIERGYRYGMLAMDLVKRFNVPGTRSRVLIVNTVFVRHWKEPLRELALELQRAYGLAVEDGEVEFAALSAVLYGLHALVLDKPLAELGQILDAYAATIRQGRQDTLLHWLRIAQQTVANLTAPIAAPYQLEGDLYAKNAMLPQQLSSNDQLVLFILTTTEVVLRVLFGEYELALSHLNKMADMPTVPTTTFHIFVMNGLDSLTRLALFAQSPRTVQQQTLRRVRQNQKKLRKCMRQAPANYAHIYHLVAAEYARVLGHWGEAREAYDQAIELAQQAGSLLQVVLAQELAGKFYMHRQQTKLAHSYWREAHATCQYWGAVAKAHHLERCYPACFATDSQRLAARPVPTPLAASDSANLGLTPLDTQSLVKALQAISKELVLDTLLQKLLETIVENVGAERGYLLTEQAGTWQQVATFQVAGQERHAEPPLALIEQVAQTRTPVVLHDAQQTSFFAPASPLAAVQGQLLNPQPVRSVLCTPLLSQEAVRGVIYLENNLVSGAFTLERLRMIELLSRQATISLENAQLYANLTQAVQQLRTTNQALSQALQSKDEFLATVSHELRTPLSVMLLKTDLFKKGAYGALVEPQQAALNVIRESGKRLLDLINGILDLVSINSQQFELKFSTVNLAALAQAVLSMVAAKAEQQQQQVSLQLAPDVPAIVSDEERLGQILQLLLDNAVKFTPSGGQVGLAVDNDVAQQQVKLTVWDTGIGIAAADGERIFQPFVQLDASASRQYAGVGLGLAIVARLTHLLGGQIALTSTVGQGSRFVVHLPWRAEQVQPLTRSQLTS